MTTQILAKFENSLWTFDAFDTAQVTAMHPFLDSGFLVWCLVRCLVLACSLPAPQTVYFGLQLLLLFLAHKMFRIVR